MKYIIDKSWFKKNGKDVFQIVRAGTTATIEIMPGVEISDKVMKMLYDMNKPYVSLAGEEKPVAKKVSKKKKVKIDEPETIKEELQEELPEASEEE